jgi:hypothetical protein
MSEITNDVYQIKKDGEVLFTGTANQCFGRLLRIQPFSTHYATTYGGYTIEPQGQVAHENPGETLDNP